MKPLWLLPLACLCWPAGSLAVPKMQPAPTAGKPPARIAPKPASRNSSAAYQEATRLYQAGKYAEAAKLLRDDGGGDGSELAQSSLHLLLLTQQKLNHCQSIIQIGQRFSRRFPQHPSAADALYAVGECQWKMQQQDIARDTWRQLRLRYPKTAAAARAQIRLQSQRSNLHQP